MLFSLPIDALVPLMHHLNKRVLAHKYILDSIACVEDVIWPHALGLSQSMMSYHMH